MKLPFGCWFGTNRDGEIIAICSKNQLSEKQKDELRKWWAKLHPEKPDSK